MILTSAHNFVNEKFDRVTKVNAFYTTSPEQGSITKYIEIKKFAIHPKYTDNMTA